MFTQKQVWTCLYVWVVLFILAMWDPIHRSYSQTNTLPLLVNFHKNHPELLQADKSEWLETMKRDNLMFVKTHKCATTTLVSMFYLNGVRKRLNLAMTPYGHFLRGKLLAPRPGGDWNMMLSHRRGGFDPRTVDEILPRASTLYTSIVRHPVSHFVSNFRYFGYEEKFRAVHGLNKTLDELVNLFLDSVPLPTNTSAPPTQDKWPLNSAAFDLNWKPFEDSGEEILLKDKISNFAKYLDKNLDLVMITERLDESLVLLKEYLGWETEDILYLPRLVSEKQDGITDETADRIMKYNVVDRVLYYHSLQQFEKHVDLVGRERVRRMVEGFQILQTSFQEECGYQLQGEGEKANPACVFLNTDDIKLDAGMTELQLSNDYRLQIESIPEFRVETKRVNFQIENVIWRKELMGKIQAKYDKNHYKRKEGE